MSLPKILVLQLQQRLYYDDMFTVKLLAKSNVQTITTAEEAIDALKSTPPPAAVLVIDKALTEDAFRQLKNEAIVYIRSGGRIILGGHFSGLAPPAKMDELFGAFSLPWRAGGYYRGTFDLNESMTGVQKAGLAQSYSQKAVHLVNVQHEDAVYLPSTSSTVLSFVFAPTPIPDLTHTPVALASFGEGKVGYIGDVNAEIESEEVVLALLGL